MTNSVLPAGWEHLEVLAVDKFSCAVPRSRAEDRHDQRLCGALPAFPWSEAFPNGCSRISEHGGDHALTPEEANRVERADSVMHDAGRIVDFKGGHWRTGRRVGRNLYINGLLIGCVDSEELAEFIVDCVGRYQFYRRSTLGLPPQASQGPNGRSVLNRSMVRHMGSHFFPVPPHAPQGYQMYLLRES